MASGGMMHGMTLSQQQQQNKEQMDRSARSVFVGNIPYEATEEKLKDIFSQAGPVLSFRLVYDRESGKPKGYGFCEYKDQETAQSAMRNLNATELHGRQLRVDSASSEKGKEEKANEPTKAEISPYGTEVHPSKAPVVITEAVASLPPEQMFDLMKQMKLCIQNNPEDARQMLLQNPQLAFALLQAQVVMKIVDPKVAQAILHQPRGDPLPTNKFGPPPPNQSHQPPPLMGNLQDVDMKQMNAPDMRGPPMDNPTSRDNWRAGDQMLPRDRRDIGPPDMHGPDFHGPPSDSRGGPMDMRDPRDFRGPMDRDEPRDMRRGPPQDRDFRDRDDRYRDAPPFDPRDRGGPMDPRDRQMPMMDPRDPRGRMDMRGPPEPIRGPHDPRGPRGRPDGPPDQRGPPPPGGRGSRDDRMLRGPGGPDSRDPRNLQMDSRDMRGPPVSRADGRDPRAGPPDPRGGPPNMRGGPPDPRGGPPDPRGGPPDPRGGPPDPRGGPPDARGGPPDPRGGPPDARGGPPDPRGGPPALRGGQPDPRGGPPDPRSGPPDARAGPPDPRFRPPPGAGGPVGPHAGPPPALVPPPIQSPQPNFLDQRKLGLPGNPDAPRDEDKAKLIMQVLSLTDEQISMLPEEQKRSIMLLKDQIARSKP